MKMSQRNIEQPKREADITTKEQSILRCLDSFSVSAYLCVCTLSGGGGRDQFLPSSFATFCLIIKRAVCCKSFSGGKKHSFEEKRLIENLPLLVLHNSCIIRGLKYYRIMNSWPPLVQTLLQHTAGVLLCYYKRQTKQTFFVPIIGHL